MLIGTAKSSKEEESEKKMGSRSHNSAQPRRLWAVECEELIVILILSVQQHMGETP